MRIKKAEKINKYQKINKSKKIKKITAALLAAAAVLTLAACSGGTSGGASDGASGGTTAASANETLAAETAETAAPATENAQTQAEETEAPETEAAATEGAETETSADEEASRVLVAYFSCTGNTEAVATQAAELLGADLYEIVPEIPYTEEDLNYNDSSRRPELSAPFWRATISPARPLCLSARRAAAEWAPARIICMISALTVPSGWKELDLTEQRPPQRRFVSGSQTWEWAEPRGRGNR